mmetsp:Transcript_62295/g.131705  ORF Transcript_62295/g.131705 Transcript_62295/m.131705 type:complete len:601 (+) Transcript_62295:163-1965(+)|eukprot:CAMPEP_0206424094 /NCGR_PEP_ID=MMETSP0324_2-20121206/3039_1 /ASSEMBLY_ACC=CAM_ASM_000836 /TAXON_ID=2866 /ORGANISM="Crypthecodinium cohnii, Strain Seligo" /LENGTH=600 /DNA_ID=CAMNT_0053888715 /DNA_START=87 /DNA_END=1889 /DNA_ORIENTATION=+
MAERVRFSIPAGQRTSHQLQWNDAELGELGLEGSLEWSVVVLDELTIDLEVSVQYQQEDAQEQPELLLLQEVQRGRTFRGTFEPSSDARLAAGSTVASVTFDFNNAFSWWTDKEVELVVLRVVPEGPPRAKVPALPAMAPLSKVKQKLDPPACDGPEVSSAAVPSLAVPGKLNGFSEHPNEAVMKLATSLDCWLAVSGEKALKAKSEVGVDGLGFLEQLIQGIDQLRVICDMAMKATQAAEPGIASVVDDTTVSTAASKEEWQHEEEAIPRITEAAEQVSPPSPSSSSSHKPIGMSKELLLAQDDRTSSAIIQTFAADPTFEQFSAHELGEILSRDEEDGRKLAEGVQQAIGKGVLPTDLAAPEYRSIDVMGKSADQVAEEILAFLPEGEGCVVILVGLSGTGKGTTVDKMKSKLSNAATWSNGNCFRALTLLAVTFCEQQGFDGFDTAVLTPENLGDWSNMLEFAEFDGSFDIRINGLGLDCRVSEVANTLLKESRVSKNIPAVAKETQGEVVRFAAEAVGKMGASGTVVLLEGREQTLNFIPSPYRFCLMMSDDKLIGQRRAAQRIAAAAKSRVSNDEDVLPALRASLGELAAAVGDS